MTTLTVQYAGHCTYRQQRLTQVAKEEEVCQKSPYLALLEDQM
jgi:hypothetical protein